MSLFTVHVNWDGSEGGMGSTIPHDSLNAALQDVENSLKQVDFYHNNLNTIVTIHRIPSAQVNQHMPNE